MPKARCLISTSSREVAASRQYTQFRAVTLPEFCHLHPAQKNKMLYKNTWMNEIHQNFVYLHTRHTISDWSLPFFPNILESCNNNVKPESKEELKGKMLCSIVAEMQRWIERFLHRTSSPVRQVTWFFFLNFEEVEFWTVTHIVTLPSKRDQFLAIKKKICWPT